MKNVQAVRIKPNPTGKDRSKSGATQTQLGAEWVDIKNTGATNVDLSGINLYHQAYKPNGTYEWQVVKALAGVLKPGEILRVHSGKGPYEILRDDDKAGCNYYLFVGESQYTWNNDRSDTPLLYKAVTKVTIDQASYDANPPEGVILQRVNDKLVPPGSTRSSAYARR